MIIKTHTWQENCEVVALRMVDEALKNFQDRLESCIPHLPLKGSAEFRKELLGIFIEAQIGICAMIGASYCGDVSSQFEDNMVLSFRRKFFELRKRSLGSEPEMSKLEIVKPEDQS